MKQTKHYRVAATDGTSIYDAGICRASSEQEALERVSANKHRDGLRFAIVRDLDDSEEEDE